MNILITGGCGFIGTNLVKYLSGKNCMVRIIDNLSTGDKQYLKTLSLPAPPEFINGDIRDQAAVDGALSGIDAIVHLAALSDVVESTVNPEATWDVNVTGTLNMLEACRKYGTKRFIFASSIAAVGEQNPPIDEMKIPRPLSPYGASKLAGEALCSAYHHSFGLETVCLRFANCYGSYSSHKSSVIPLFLKLAEERKPLIIYGDGNQTRDFVHVDDICQAIFLSLTVSGKDNRNISVFGEVFQIGSGVEITLNRLIEELKKTGRNDIQVVYKAERKGEIRRSYSSIDKARIMLRFEPKITLAEGLRHV